MRGPICKVCACLARKKIDADLVGGLKSLREMSASYGFTKSTLHNHRIRCMGAPTNAPQEEPPKKAARKLTHQQKRLAITMPSRMAYLDAVMPTREELALQLENVIERLDQIVAKNEVDGGVDVIAVSGLNSIRATVSDLAKLAGHVGGPAQTQVNVGVNVAISANDIASALAGHLSGVKVKPSELLELSVDE